MANQNIVQSQKALKLLKVIVIISIVGFLDALYLFYIEMSGKAGCLIREGIFDCVEVNLSDYAKIFGIPISLLGAVYYLAVMFNVRQIVASTDKYWLKIVLPTLTLFGAMFSIYLTIIEIFVLKALCEFCLLSAVCTWTICPLALLTKKHIYNSIFVF